jgi:peptidylprolyl isomerase
VKHRLTRSLAPVALVLVSTLALTACGSSSGSTESSSAPAGTGSTAAGECPAGTPTSADYTVGTAGVTVTGEAAKKPTVAIGTETAKTAKLTVCDITVGTGPAVASGGTVTAHYVGVGAASGKQFDASWDRGKPVTFPLGNVIEGWQKGLPGMKEGGRRVLVFVVDIVPTPVPTVGPHVEGTAGVTVTGDPGKEPTVKVSAETAKVAQLTISDITVGTGAVVKPGATVTANYIGVGGISGKTFDSSFTNGQPAQFPLVNVIQGWQDGIPGMKVGGRRLLVIPGAQAYGANPPSGSGIAANEPLVFVVDIVSSP